MEIKIGTPVSPGIAIGSVELLSAEEISIPRRFIRKDEVAAELERWERCKERARQEIESIRDSVHNVVKSEVALIFDTHARILDDPALNREIAERIKIDRYSPEYAVSRAFRKVVNAIRELEDSYFGQRALDFVDIQKRLLRALTGQQREAGVSGPASNARKVVIVAHDLTPSQTASFAKDQVLAFATDLGGPTSHTAILANALGMPAVVGLDSITADVAGGETIIIDGTRGRVIISPDEATRRKYEALADEYRTAGRRFFEGALLLPNASADGEPIDYLANVEFDDEVEAAVKSGASGLGLYRTEFIFTRHRHPTENDHFACLLRALQTLGPRPLTVRTLDFGADKFREEAGLPHEDNPFLGNRSLRLCLQQPEMFHTQLRAILRASMFGDIRLMLPMVGSLSELREAKAQLDMVRDGLRSDGMAFKERVPVGIMIEVPSAAIIADILAKECDFFSIGTNDLVQYTLAVDRNNPSVGHLYHHTHPAVLALVKRVIDAGNAAGIPVSVCGEMAGDVELAILLVGMGVRRLSVTPSTIPMIKTAIGRVTISQARKLADECLALHMIDDVDAHLKAEVGAMLGAEFGYQAAQ